MEKTTQQRNKDIVLEAFDTLFNKRDYAKAETFWSPKYATTRSPSTGVSALMSSSVSPSLKYPFSGSELVFTNGNTTIETFWAGDEE